MKQPLSPFGGNVAAINPASFQSHSEKRVAAPTDRTVSSGFSTRDGGTTRGVIRAKYSDQHLASVAFKRAQNMYLLRCIIINNLQVK